MIGKTLGHYRILEEIGKGGMGVVYRAHDDHLQRDVALKVLPPTAITNDDARKQLRREALVLSKLNHRNIGAVYDFDSQNGIDFLVMELVDGVMLESVLSAGPLSDAQVVNYGLQIASGLEAAHERGIAHRDLKPSNVMITTKGDVKVLDFGLARFFKAHDGIATQSETKVYTAAGTLLYMSPEVLKGELADGRSDIWSFGILLFQMCSGRPPFGGKTGFEISSAIVNAPLPPLPPRVSSAIRDVIERCLQKDPDKRFQIIGEVRNELNGQPSHVDSIPFYRSVAVKAVFGAFVLFAILIGTRVWRSRNRIVNPPVVTTPPPNKQLALLPVSDVSGTDTASMAFGNGLVETLTSRLEQVTENHQLEIIPVSEVRAKGVTNAEQAREEFGSNLSLELDCHRSGDLMRVNYHLIDGTTHHQLRGGSVTEAASDPFKLEDEVADSVLAALDMELEPGEKVSTSPRGTTESSAYDFYLQGRGYLQDSEKPENIESAITQFNKALAADKSYALAHAGLGEAYWYKYLFTHDSNWTNRASEECNMAVQLQSNATEGYICLGTVYKGSGKYDQSATAFEQAVKLDPSNDDAVRGLASAYESLQQPAKAERAYRHAIEIRPQRWQNYSFLGAFYAAQGNFQGAADMFEQVIRLAPDSFRGYSNLGATYLYQGRFEDATVALKHSIEIRPTDDAYSNLGTSYFNLRQFAAAADSYKEAARLDDHNYAVWGNLGDAYYYGGDRALANAAYHKAISLGEEQLKVNPHDTDLLPSVAGYYSMVGDRTAAFSLIDRALQLAPNDAQVLCIAGLIHNQFGETDEAISFLHRAIKAGYSIAQLRNTPAVDNLQKDPRFTELLGPRAKGM